MPDLTSSDSQYDDETRIATSVAQGHHRDVIGGLWDEVGSLQFEFLKQNGLLPEHHLVDIGCGSLRGGVHFAAYLQPAHYWGIDISESLLEAGYEIELKNLGLTDRVPRANLLHDGEFNFERFNQKFDAAIATSLFTHLSSNRIRLCFVRLAKTMPPGGRFYATYFEAPETHPFDKHYVHANPERDPQGVTRVGTFAYKDPFHYRLSDLEALASGLPWRLVWVGDWGHPRHQKLAIFERTTDAQPGEPAPDADVRGMDTISARGLRAGATHYRAYVGPPNRFDFMGASQFSLLFTLGLRDHHSVLDFGCGSLRLGRLLIPYLEPGRYFGIDPNRWLIEDGLSRELGWSAVNVKRPTFAYNDDFRCSVFGRRFDFIIAQSIITHCGPELTRRLLGEMAAALEDNGIAAFSIIETPEQRPENVQEGWVYPACVGYHEKTMIKMCNDAGMSATRIPWYHPGAVWYVASRDPDRIPTANEMSVLSGSVLFDPQFAAGRPARNAPEQPNSKSPN